MGYKDLFKKREYQLAFLKNRRDKWIKENGPCKNCGSSERLEVDHIDRECKITHKIWSWNKEDREAELIKCQVLCYKCHKIKTIKEKTKKVEHGTDTLL